jgi:23S rRNA pseudouridine2604 synthase
MQKQKKVPQAKPLPNAEAYPMRINKYLAHQGVATRRAADELIARGKVVVNGRVATLGEKVNEGDTVEIRDNRAPKKLVYYAFNKPVGVITHSPQLGERDVKKSARLGSDVYPIGRLDKDSSGLLILTNDGRVTERLLSPTHDHDKEYRVRVREPLRESFKKNMEAGITIEGYQTKPCTVRKTGPKSFTITLTEGKKHQIRRMVSAMHNEVEALERTRILNVRLDALAPGETRPIEGSELNLFLTALGLQSPGQMRDTRS